MTPEKLLELLKAHINCGSFTKQDYDYFYRKIGELEFEMDKDADIGALEIRIERLIKSKEFNKKDCLDVDKIK